LRWAVLVICGWMVAGCASVERNAGVHQIVEVREGRRSVWGIAVSLPEGQFNPVVKEDQISIIESKYRGEMKGIMVWSVDADGRTLRVVFKAGTGDFGSGNDVTVRIDRVATMGCSGRNNVLEWHMPTDPQ
jgi:hypothetical protein